MGNGSVAKRCAFLNQKITLILDETDDLQNEKD